MTMATKIMVGKHMDREKAIESEAQMNSEAGRGATMRDGPYWDPSDLSSRTDRVRIQHPA